MKPVEQKLAQDVSLFGESLTEYIFMDTWQKRLWGAWQVLIGNGALIIHRIAHSKKYKK